MTTRPARDVSGSGPGESEGATAPLSAPSLLTRLADHAWLRVMLLFVLALMVSAPLVAAEVKAHPGVSVIDEAMYIDYLNRVHHGQIVLPHGQRFSAETLHELSCRGFENPLPGLRPRGAGCATPPYVMSQFPNLGYNSADIYTPTYFVLTDLGARVVLGLGVTDNLVTAGRLVGAVWMALALTVVFLLARELGASRTSAVLAMALTGSAPWLLVFWTHLTPDGASVAMGGLIVLTALRWERRRLAMPWMILAVVLAVAIKPTNLLAALLVGVYFLVRAAAHRWRPRTDAAVQDDEQEALAPVGARLPRVRRDLLGLVVAVGAAAVTTVAWLLVHRLLPQGATTRYDRRNPPRPFTLSWITENVTTFLRIPQYGQPDVRFLWLLPVGLIVVAVAVLVITRPRTTRLWAVAAATSITVFAGSVTLVLMLTIMSKGVYFRTEPRYGMSLFAAGIALTATACRTRATQVAMALVTLVLLAQSLLWLR